MSIKKNIYAALIFRKFRDLGTLGEMFSCVFFFLLLTISSPSVIRRPKSRQSKPARKL